MKVTLHDRYRGALLDLAVGDALGATLEFSRPGTFTPLTDMIGGGPFRLRAGQWTDNTSMALGLATSLVEKGFDCGYQRQQRFAFNADQTKIRANQGHSIPVDLQLLPTDPPDVLYHGTASTANV